MNIYIVETDKLPNGKRTGLFIAARSIEKAIDLYQKKLVEYGWDALIPAGAAINAVIAPDGVCERTPRVIGPVAPILTKAA